MLGLIIHLLIQIALAAYAIRVAIKLKDAQDQGDQIIDSRRKNIVGLVVAPVFSLAYFSMGGFPPKSYQLLFAGVSTVIIYIAMILRWRRQSLQAMDLQRASAKRYFYRDALGGVPLHDAAVDR